MRVTPMKVYMNPDSDLAARELYFESRKQTYRVSLTRGNPPIADTFSKSKVERGKYIGSLEKTRGSIEFVPVPHSEIPRYSE